MNCNRCHACGSPIHIVLDGEEWCDSCQAYQRPRAHGWAPGLGDSTPCAEVKKGGQYATVDTRTVAGALGTGTG